MKDLIYNDGHTSFSVRVAVDPPNDEDARAFIRWLYREALLEKELFNFKEIPET